MFLKQKLPLQLFCILEKIKPVIWTSETNAPNHYYIFLPAEWFKPLNYILKKELSCSQTFLTDMSAIDSLNYFSPNSEFDLFLKKTRLLPFYNYYCLSTKIRLTFILKPENNLSFESIDKVFKGANCGERELSEMYGLIYYNKRDTRKILLDYSAEYNPLRKDFTCENSKDVYYNILEERISYIGNNIIEL